MNKALLWAGASLALGWSLPAVAQADLAKAFGAREAVQGVSISPDGTRIAIIEPTPGAGAALFVGEPGTSGDMKAILKSSGRPDRLTECRWATNTRLVCSIFMVDKLQGTLLSVSRLVSINADGSNLKQLSARTSEQSLGMMQSGGEVIDWGGDGSGSLLVTRDFVPEQTTGRLTAATGQGRGVERVDAETLVRRTVEQPRGMASYVSDGHGIVRIIGIQETKESGYLAARTRYQYRRPGSRNWESFSTGSPEAQPVAVDSALNVAYVFDKQDGRTALFRVALDGSLKRELVLARPDVDVDSLIAIGRQERIVGISYATDKRTAQFFDPELAKLNAALGRALPGQPNTRFVDATADESKLILFAGGDRDPGSYYLFDKKTKQLAPIMPVRPELAGVKLASIKSVTYVAADGTHIPAYLTLPADSDGKNLPAIVMPHGGPASRDEWGFDWLPQFFAARGFAVLQPQYRGSSGYGEAWFQKNGFQSWQTAIGDVNDGGRWLLSQGIAAPGKIAIVGWSYGGYAALQSSVLDPNLFKAIVAVAPVTDLETLRGEHRNVVDFEQVSGFIGTGPHIVQGSPAQNTAKITAPVLLFHGDQDLNVGVGESRLMASRLKAAGRSVSYVEFAGLDHQLEDDHARTELLAKSDAFLRAALKMP